MATWFDLEGCTFWSSGINFTVTQLLVTEKILQLPKKIYSYRKKFTVTGLGYVMPQIRSVPGLFISFSLLKG